jgi:hypothetical protein
MDPELALSEMIRVTKPGGWIVALDTDWNTISEDTTEFEIEQRLRRFYVDEFLHNALAGRQLYRLFRLQKLADVSVEMCPIYVTDYAVGRRGAMRDELERDALAAGLVTEEELLRYRRSLEQADAEGIYFGCIVQVLLAGRKPWQIRLRE